ncbi:cbb3-type cytochrome oxidase assembly protein CcoS [Belliella sp. DSM 111904]|uniref:Cbb3-type cytochrome oxidase assembly protein CcoS n=1 Tax=Belliella filtrata TaxID=2923435 RepID=A0ABS9UZ41_9BACT|nr:cbb3-type cytochrome oxidase assembly protein CcoS [Belliella filtrata]MCH7409224.1 cbb3-type cytochrome oxidase assembly protein CcoS [Belliella filtrata]
MEVIFILIAISLVMAGSFLLLFFKAMKSGQFEDNHTPAIRILFDSKPSKKSNKVKSTKSK